MLLNEQQFKKELSLRTPKGGYLLSGGEAELVVLYRGRLLKLLEQEGADIERLDAKTLNLDILCENFLTMPLMGGSRAFAVDGLEVTGLSEGDCATYCQLLASADENTVLVISTQGEFDLKKSSKAKKLSAAADKSGAFVTFDKRSPAILRENVRALCHRQGCELSVTDAALLVERCGDDLGILKQECEKLCAYVSKDGQITSEIIKRVTSLSAGGDLYAVAKLMLKGELAPVMREINTLLAQKQPAALLLASLGTAFAELYQASTARGAGIDATQATKDLNAKFSWRMQNAFRDSARLDSRGILKVCRILCDAETDLKSRWVNERALLETAAIRSLAALRGETL